MPKKAKPISLRGIVESIDKVTKELKAAKKLVNAQDKQAIDAEIHTLDNIKASVKQQCIGKKPTLAVFPL
jgi:hypothetical protein